jgi:hypothetical protein
MVRSRQTERRKRRTTSKGKGLKGRTQGRKRRTTSRGKASKGRTQGRKRRTTSRGKGLKGKNSKYKTRKRRTQGRQTHVGGTLNGNAFLKHMTNPVPDENLYEESDRYLDDLKNKVKTDGPLRRELPGPPPTGPPLMSEYPDSFKLEDQCIIDCKKQRNVERNEGK